MRIDKIETLGKEDLEERMRVAVARTDLSGFQSSPPLADLLLDSLILYLFPYLIV